MVQGDTKQFTHKQVLTHLSDNEASAVGDVVLAEVDVHYVLVLSNAAGKALAAVVVHRVRCQIECCA